MSVLFVGMNPGRPRLLGKNSAIARLYCWASELSVDNWVLVNLYDEDGPFDRRKVALSLVSRKVKGYEDVVALGGTPSHYLAKLGVEHFKLPHPSYRNRLLNSREYEARVLQECREWLRRRL